MSLKEILLIKNNSRGEGKYLKKDQLLKLLKIQQI